MKIHASEFQHIQPDYNFGCHDPHDIFKNLFPDGMEITEENLIALAAAGQSIDEIIWQRFSGTAKVDLQNATQKADTDRKVALKRAQEVRKEAVRVAGRAEEEITIPYDRQFYEDYRRLQDEAREGKISWDEFCATTKQLSDTKNSLCATARAEFEAADAAAKAAYDAAIEQADWDYNTATEKAKQAHDAAVTSRDAKLYAAYEAAKIPAKQKFDDAVARANAVRQAAKNAAYKEYEATVNEAKAAYEAVRIPAEEKLVAVRIPAEKTFEAAKAAAWTEYNMACACVFWGVYQNSGFDAEPGEVRG